MQLTETIYTQYLGSVYRYAFFHLHNKEDAEDIASEVFIRFMKQENNVEKVKAWLLGTARNVLREKYRDLIKNRAEDVDSAGTAEVIESETNVEEQVLTAELREAVIAELNVMGQPIKDIVILKVWEELSFEEIADVLELNVNTVKTLYYRGIENLKNSLKKKNKKAFVLALPTLLAVLAQYGGSKVFSPDVAVAEQLMQNLNFISQSNYMEGKMLMPAKSAPGFARLWAKPIGKMLIMTFASAIVVCSTALGAWIFIQTQTMRPAHYEATETSTSATASSAETTSSAKVEEIVTLVAYSTTGNDPIVHLYNVNTGADEVIAHGSSPTLNPAGTKLAYIKSMQSGSGPKGYNDLNIYIYDIATKQTTTILTSEGLMTEVIWSDTNPDYITTRAGTDVRGLGAVYSVSTGAKLVSFDTVADLFVLSDSGEGYAWADASTLIYSQSGIAQYATAHRPWHNGAGRGVLRMDLATGASTVLLQPSSTVEYAVVGRVSGGVVVAQIIDSTGAWSSMIASDYVVTYHTLDTTTGALSAALTDIPRGESFYNSLKAIAGADYADLRIRSLLVLPRSAHTYVLGLFPFAQMDAGNYIFVINTETGTAIKVAEGTRWEICTAAQYIK